MSKKQGKNGVAVDDGPLYNSTALHASADDQANNRIFLPLIA